MAVAVGSMQVAKPSGSSSRWRVAMLMIVLGMLLSVALAGALTHAAELGMATQQMRQLVTAANVWLSTTAAQAFTMQCTHAAAR
jgi:NhaP-type Na+/H+ or K+/H+ antiporter